MKLSTPFRAYLFYLNRVLSNSKKNAATGKKYLTSYDENDIRKPRHVRKRIGNLSELIYVEMNDRNALRV
jgi:hypothetical protein